MTLDELVELYKTEKTGEVKELVLVEILNNMEIYIKSFLSKEYHFLLSPEYREDVIQDCLIAVLEQLKTYNPTSGIPFITYCYLPIQHKAYLFITQNIYKTSGYYQNRYGKVTFENYDELKEILLTDDILETNTINKIDLLKAIACLNDMQKYLITEFYFHGKKLQDISDATGWTKKHITNSKIWALQKMKRELQKGE